MKENRFNNQVRLELIKYFDNEELVDRLMKKYNKTLNIWAKAFLVTGSQISPKVMSKLIIKAEK